MLRFVNTERFRLGPTNDEGFYLGQCRFTGIAPAWGEFYRISGPAETLNAPSDWKILQPKFGKSAHYLFYFRDETFECVAEECESDVRDDNALLRAKKRIPF